MAEKKNSYGNRPLWQWILLYIVIGGILYFLIYKFVLHGGGYSAPSTGYQSAPNSGY